MADISNLTVEFAKKIQKTKEYLNLQKAKKNNDEDVELKKMLDLYNKLTEEVKILIEEKEPNREKINEKNVEISETYKKIMANKNMIKFNKASNDVNVLMNRINNILIEAVNGEDFESCGKNKVFNCGSCGKCSGKK